MKKYKHASIILILSLIISLLPATVFTAERQEVFVPFGECEKIEKDESLQLVPARTWKGGGIWSRNPIDLSKPLSLTFDFYMGEGRPVSGMEKHGDGADGISVSFTQTLPADDLQMGEGQSFYGDGAFGVEYDTWYNDYDPFNDHIAIIRDTVSNHLQKKDYTDQELDDCKWHSTKIVYDNGILEVWFDGMPVLKSVEGQIPKQSSAFLCIAAATGIGTNVHKIKNVTINENKIVLAEEVEESNNKEGMFSGHRYQLFDEPLTWRQARDKCNKMGGHLVTITSKLENDFIKKEVLKGDSLYYWLGGTDEEQEGKWKWVTGEEWSYTNWRNNQPDNANHEEHYLMMYQGKDSYNSGGLNGLWNDENMDCSMTVDLNRQGYICEWETENSFDGEFEYYTYRAHSVTNNSAMADAIEENKNTKTPANEIILALQENGVENALALLQSIEIVFDTVKDVSNLYDILIGGKELYEAVIFDTLRNCSSNGFHDFIKERISDGDKIISNVETAYKAQYNRRLSSEMRVSELSLEQQNFINDLVSDFYTTKLGKMNTVAKVFEFTNNYYEMEATIEDYLKTLSGNIALIQMGETQKIVMQKLYEVCPSGNSELKAALKECANMTNANMDEFLNMIGKNLIKETGEQAIHFFSDKYWSMMMDRIYLRHPAVAALISGYETGTFVSNAIYSTDEFKGKYFETLAINDVEMLMEDVYKWAYDQYQLETNQKNAATLLSALDLTFDFRDCDCVKSYELVKILDDAKASWLSKIWNPDQFESPLKYISMRQKKYMNTSELSKTGWVNTLDVDFPGSGLYEKYQYIFSESAQRMVDKKFVIACPVNIYIYNNKDEIVGKVVKNIPWVKEGEEFSIGVVNDEKTIYFCDGADYHMKYCGYDMGQMDISVTEYEKGETIKRNICFYDIPLEANKEYMQEVKSTTDDYTLITDNEKQLKPNTDSKISKKHKIDLHLGMITAVGDMMTMKGVCGEKVSIKALIPKGYTFVCWESGQGKVIFADPYNPVTTFVMPDQDISIDAKIRKNNNSIISGSGYSEVSYKVEVAQNIGGKITPKEESIKFGASQTFTITPDPGYEIADVLVDGKSIGAVSSYTFNNVTTDHTISATFKKVTPERPDNKAAIIKAAKNVKLKAATSAGTTKKGKAYIKIKWKKTGAVVTGYQVYRSFKKKEGYKKFFTTKKMSYINTKQLKKGKRHYYKIRAYTVIDGKKYYSKWSNLVSRTLKR